jgi:hypothetical protein
MRPPRDIGAISVAGAPPGAGSGDIIDDIIEMYASRVAALPRALIKPPRERSEKKSGKEQKKNFSKRTNHAQ